MLVRQRGLFSTRPTRRRVSGRFLRLRQLWLQEQRPCFHPLNRCRRNVHRYDVGRDHEANTAGNLLPAESNRAEWSTPRLARNRGASWQ